ncbi:hypothetical protein [Priestia megaterium]|uniref:hypothetical protein n=1 Tax=Priestia megaterium TaxID=1404 RepID=UPI002E243300|nr:hypothetical protein [Priestia megaterium]
MNNFIVSIVKMIWKLLKDPVIREKLKKLLWELIITIVKQVKEEKQKSQQARG